MSDRGRRSDSEKEGPTSSEVAANKKVPVSKVDMIGFVLGCIGFFLLNFAVNSTNCPVRVGHYDTELNYPDRRYWYFAVTNNYDKPMTWKYLEAQACEKFDMAEEKFGGAFGRAGTMLFSQLPFVGGALPCEAKDGCRNSLRNRCYMYKNPAYWKLAHTIFNALSAVLVCGAGLIMLLFRKKKYRIFVAVCYTFALFLPMINNFILEQQWDVLFNSMQTLAPYPFGESQSTFGYCFGQMMWFGQIFLFLACCAGCCGVLPEKEEVQLDSDGEPIDPHTRDDD